MGYVLEANPYLISSAYWENLDVDDRKAFTGQTEHLHLSHAEHTTAALALGSCMSDLLNEQTKDTLFSEQGSFDPEQDKMPDGTVMILDTEYLIRWDDDRDRLAVEGGLFEYGVDWDHIAYPLTDYWVSHQNLRDPDGIRTNIGEEHAGFPDQKAFYYRALSWAVLLHRAEDERGVLDTWPFREPTIDSQYTIHVSAGQKQATAQLPVQIGEVVPDPRMSRRLSPRSVHRIIDVTAIESEKAMRQFEYA